MKKLLLILLMFIQFDVFSQNFEFNFGSSFLIPFKSKHIDLNQGVDDHYSTKIGIYMSFGKSFIFKSFNERLFIKPSIDYVNLRYNIKENLGSWPYPSSSVIEQTMSSHYLNLSTYVGYKLNDKLQSSIGFSLDNKTQDVRKNILVDGQASEFRTENKLNFNHWLLAYYGLSSSINLRYNLTSNIFTNLKVSFPISVYRSSDLAINNPLLDDLIVKKNIIQRRFSMIGVGYNF